jgi:hypothetical protein
MMPAEILTADRTENAFFQAEFFVKIPVGTQLTRMQQVVDDVRGFQTSEEAGVFLEKASEHVVGFFSYWLLVIGY